MNRPEQIEYDESQQNAAKALGNELHRLKSQLKEQICSHAIAVAYLSVGVDAASETMPPDAVADWLRSIADELERGPVCAGNA